MWVSEIEREHTLPCLIICEDFRCRGAVAGRALRAEREKIQNQFLADHRFCYRRYSRNRNQNSRVHRQGKARSDAVR